VKIVTWNVNSIRARTERVIPWLEANRPDVLCMQELKVEAEKFPMELFTAIGYEVVLTAQKTYNGVAIASLKKATDVRVGLDDGVEDPQARLISAVIDGVRIASAYIPNGQAVGSDKFEYKLQWMDRLRRWLDKHNREEQLALCGDFNVAPSDADVWDASAFAGSTHVSAPERDAIRELLALGLLDVQPRALKGEPYTYWDYRAGMFHKGEGMRIDLVLLSQALAAAVTDAYVDRDARKGSKPSDHAPVVVDLAL
jgi:exodeoxyribonuclease-3